MSNDTPALPAETFKSLGLPDRLLGTLDTIGYESPSPIQARTIPLLLQGKDVLGQAQTGTGKTAAFALPLLARLDPKQKQPQVLVLAPTRELAIQVAEAFHTYARGLDNFHVLPVYGGGDYSIQLRALKRGVQIVVGTPGRVMDHMRRGTLDVGKLQALVLDEADEMLRMGFIDDVEWILEQTPDSRQIALFSATMPEQIKRIASRFLQDPEVISIKVKTTTADTIRQRYWPVSGIHKLDALTRILEAENFDAMIIFVRTKTLTVELADKLRARGFSATALNGDIAQNQREKTIAKLKKGEFDILVATDVAARGLDVERISHVINYDIPYDTEAYVHRIGRTGRAGRSGDAILFVAPREKRMLHAIEKATRNKIEIMALPSTEFINDQRIARFKQSITDTLAKEDLEDYAKLIEQYQQEHNIPANEIAAALARMVQGDKALLLEHKPVHKETRNADRSGQKPDRPKRNKKPFQPGPLEPGMERFRLEVGHDHQVKPGNIVGAIANEAGIESKYIGKIEIFDDHSMIDLPEGMPRDVFKILQKTWVSGQQLNISRFGEEAGKKTAGGKRKKPARRSRKPNKSNTQNKA